MGAGQYYTEQAAKQTLGPNSLFSDPAAANAAAPPQAPNALTATSGLTPGQIANRNSILQMAKANNKQAYQRSDGYLVIADPGLPQSAIDQGITSAGDYQLFAQNQIADKQIAAQKEIVAQQNAFNQQQLAEAKRIQDLQQKAIEDQAFRQTTYNQGQTRALGDASERINAAFGGFSDEYFNQYVRDYMAQVGDQLGYQRGQADKQMLFGLSRQGIQDSQELANKTGLLDEAQGHTLADEITKAQGAAGDLRTKVGSAKQGLLGQVAQAQAIGPPITTSSLGDVNAALDQQNRAISGIATNAGDVVASIKGVPSVSALGDVFTGIIGAGKGYLGGANARDALNRYYSASGSNPNSKSTSIIGR